jgi:4-amino-4-deoxy-L-arabinose transferase-like glycosyltransferase
MASLFRTPLDMTGRTLSAVAMAAACCFLFDLVRRHDGTRTALVASAVLAATPVTIRFGRAFQPDSLMISSLVVAVWAMARWREDGKRRHLAVAALATCLALLLKVISAYVLLPLAYLAWDRHRWALMRRMELWFALAVAVVPALGWYFHAWHVAASSATVSTPFWQLDKWLAWNRFFDPTTYRQLVYFVGWRMLTPLGVVLGLVGALVRPHTTSPKSAAPRSLLFHIWFGSLVMYLPILMRKLDHEHYYLALAPVAAVFIGRALVTIAAAPLSAQCYVSGRIAAIILGLALFASDAIACRSTFRDPSEWRHVTAAAAATRACTPPGALVAGHSSVLFYADRRGFTYAYGKDEIEYLFGTWGERNRRCTPEELLEFYRQQGAQYFVELLGTNRERDNAMFFDYVRRRYEVVREQPGQFVVVSLSDEEGR